MKMETFSMERNNNIKDIKKKIETLRAQSDNDTNSTEIVKMLCELAFLLCRSEPGQAEVYGNQALTLADRIHFKKGSAESHNVIGTSYFVRGNYDKALKCYSMSLKISEESGHRKGIASCYSNIGNIHTNKGDFEQALANHFRALKIKEEIGDKPSTAKSYNSIGIIYDKLKEYNYALENYHKALHLFEELGDKKGIAFSCNNIGVVFETQGESTAALEYYNNSLKIKKIIGDKKGISSSYLNIGTLYKEQKEFDLALEYCLNALEIFREIGDKRCIADSYINIGCIYTQLKNYDSAHNYLQKGIDLAQKIGTKDLEMDSNKFFSELYQIQNDFKQALEHHRRYSILKEEIFNSINTENISKMQIKYEIEKREREIEIYRDIFENTLIGIYTINPEGHILMANSSLITMLGFSSFEELKQQNIQYELNNSEHPNFDFIKHIKGKDTVLGLELVWSKHDGSSLFIRLSSRAIRDKSGDIQYYEGIVEDITRYQQAEKLLTKSEEKYRTLVETLEVGIGLVDENEYFTIVNQAASNIFGYTKDELIGKNLIELTTPEMFQQVIKETSLRKKDESNRYELTILKKNGEQRIIKVDATPKFSKNRKYEGSFAIFRDITKNKQSEAEREILLFEINERVKELNCLYSLSKLAENQDIKLEDLFYGLIEIILTSWQFPEYTCARIIFKNSEFKSDNFVETKWKQDAQILINGQINGVIQVYYTKKFTDMFKKPFLKEERQLINEIADRLANIIQQKKATEIIATERQRLSYILEGTNVGTWEWNIQTGDTNFNERWAEIIGYTIEEISPVSINTWIKYCHPDDLKVSDELLNKHFNKASDYYECECRMLHKNGTWIWVLDRGKVLTWTDDGKPLLMCGTHSDITEKKMTEEKIFHMATHDALTDLPNLNLVKDRIIMAIETSRRNKTSVAIMFIDLDNFKIVNDSFGHEIGDCLLQKVAKRFLSCIRKTDSVARVGGDEFLIVLTELQSSKNAELIAKKIIQFISKPFIFNDKHASVGVSIGISLYPDNGTDYKTLITKADRAMYVVKNSGKNNFLYSN